MLYTINIYLCVYRFEAAFLLERKAALNFFFVFDFGYIKLLEHSNMLDDFRESRS